MGSWKGRGNQYIQLVKVLYCKLSTNGRQLPAFPLAVGLGTEPRPQRWEARVLPLYNHGPRQIHSGSGDHLKWRPLSLHPFPSGRLKNLMDVDKWSSLSLCLSVRGMSVIRVGLYLFSQMGQIAL